MNPAAVGAPRQAPQWPSDAPATTSSWFDAARSAAPASAALPETAATPRQQPSARHTPGKAAWWPGVFTGGVLHRVLPSNRERVHYRGGVYGVAECGAICVPALDTQRKRTRCPACEAGERTPNAQDTAETDEKGSPDGSIERDPGS